MDRIEALYAAAEHAGMLLEAIWSHGNGDPPVTVKVDFQAPDEAVLDGLALSADYAIRYPAKRLPGLVAGDTLTINGQTYRVRETRVLGDGSEKRATLTRL
jgi:hypothetical protein